MSNQKDFDQFTITDFVWNDDFRKWVLLPDSELNSFWNNWLNNNPEKKADVYTAKEVICNLLIKEPELSEENVAVEKDRLINEINKKE